MKIILLEKTFEELCKDNWLTIGNKNKWLWKAFVIKSWNILEAYIYLDRWKEKYFIAEWFNSRRYLSDIYSDISSATNGLIEMYKKHIDADKESINHCLKNISKKELEIIKIKNTIDEYNKNNS